MTLGDRCDEIVRLIDETLLSVAPMSPRCQRSPGGPDLDRWVDPWPIGP